MVGLDDVTAYWMGNEVGNLQAGRVMGLIRKNDIKGRQCSNSGRHANQPSKFKLKVSVFLLSSTFKDDVRRTVILSEFREIKMKPLEAKLHC